MADQKISQLNPITGASIDDTADFFVLADMSNADNKKVTREELFKNVSALSTTGAATIGNDLTVSGSLGIGTSATSYPLEISGGTNSTVLVTSDANQVSQLVLGEAVGSLNNSAGIGYDGQNNIGFLSARDTTEKKFMKWSRFVPEDAIVISSTGDIGVNKTPSHKLDINGDCLVANNFYLDRSSDASFLQMAALSDGLFDVNPFSVSGTSKAVIRLFRSTNTTGEVSFDILKGDNTVAVQHRLSGNNLSYFCAQGQRASFGTANDLGAKLNVETTDNNSPSILARGNNASFTDTVLVSRSTRSASSTFSIMKGQSSNGTETLFHLRGDGDAFCDKAWSGGGADYAEWWEWHPSYVAMMAGLGEIQGFAVVLEDGYVRPALPEDDPFHIIGAVSHSPAVVGNSDIDQWRGKYLRNHYGAYIWEDVEVVDEETGETVLQKQKALNPAYDPEEEYIPRADRPEWVLIGHLGRLRVDKGQPLGDRWLKVKDITEDITEYFVR